MIYIPLKVCAVAGVEYSAMLSAYMAILPCIAAFDAPSMYTRNKSGPSPSTDPWLLQKQLVKDWIVYHPTQLTEFC